MVERDDGSRCLLTYSLGNFISGMQDGFNMLGGMLSFDIVKSVSGDIYIDSPLFTPVVTHYNKETAVASDDTGHRNYKIYPLSMYTDDSEIARTAFRSGSDPYAYACRRCVQR